MSGYRAILIAGPTAAGKSALAIHMARRHRGVVINADSMQVYRELRVLTARPSEAEMEGVPHLLFGHVGGGEAYSVGRWLTDATAAIEAAWSEARMPVVVGGTGLYFKALMNGLSPIPAVPDEIRSYWRKEASKGACELYEVLQRRDPETAAGLHPTDAQRLTRALEVLDATGKGLAAWQEVPGTPFLGEDDTERFVVSRPRGDLHARADARFDQMMAEGALEEVRGLAACGYDGDLPVMRALGVAPLMAAIAGKHGIDEAVAQSKLATRQYIKRQETWLRRNMMSWRIQ